MSFLKQSYIYFANAKLHEAYQFSKILTKSLDPSAQVTVLRPSICQQVQRRWAPYPTPALACPAACPVMADQEISLIRYTGVRKSALDPSTERR
jgi:hypothetical protein